MILTTAVSKNIINDYENLIIIIWHKLEQNNWKINDGGTDNVTRRKSGKLMSCITS